MNFSPADPSRGRRSPRGVARPTLLQPKNRLATLQRGGRSPPQMIFEREGIDDLVSQLCAESPPSAGVDKLPVVFYAVLGNNNYGLRALHTDWLIHYFEHWDRLQAGPEGATIADIYKLWRPPVFGPHADQLRYVSDMELFKLHQVNAPEGVYIWPTPYQVEEADGTGGKQSYLCFVLYAHGGSDENLIVDLFTAGVTSKVVVFKEQEKDKLRNFIKTMNNEELPPFLSFVPATRQITLARPEKSPAAMEAGWVTFAKVLKEKGTIEKTGKVSLLPTLSSFITHLDDITNYFNVLPEVVDTWVPPPRAVENGMGAHRQKPREKRDSPGRLGAVDLTPSDPLVESFRNWLQNEILFPLSSDLAQEITGSDPDLVKGLQLCQSVLTVYYLELQNMFGNYVCFSGRVDEKQLMRLQKAARVREQNSWEKAEGYISSKVLPVVKHLEEEICNWLARRILEENLSIIDNEIKLAALVRDNLVKSYTQQMRKYLKSGGRVLEEADLEGVHHRMWNQCRETMSHCLAYNNGAGGKLNQVLADQLHLLESQVNEAWVHCKKNSKGSSPSPRASKLDITATPPRGFHREVPEDDADTVGECNHRMEGYMADVKNTINAGFCDAENLEDVHEHTLQKYFGDAPDTLMERWEEISGRLYTYLVYTWEQFQATLEGEGDDDSSHPLVIYLTDTVMRALVRKSHGLEYVLFQDTGTTSCPAEIAVKRQSGGGGPLTLFGSKAQKVAGTVEPGKGEWHGTVFSCIRAAKEKPKFASDMIQALLQYLSKTVRKVDPTAERAFCSVAIIVPSWFTLGERTLLRNAATQADFQRKFLLNESSLAAYHSLVISGHLSQGALAVVVIARHDAVQVEIFQEQEPKRLSLMAVAQEKCTCRPGTWRPNENYVRVLQSTYSRALQQLSRTVRKTSGKECLILAENPDWKPALEEGLHSEDHTLTIRKDLDVQNFVGAAAIKLGKHLSKVGRHLVDHIHLPEEI